MKTLFGRWWIPEDPEHEVVGVLIADDEDFWLELESDFTPSLHSDDGALVFGYHLEIHGDVGGTAYTLLNAYQTSKGSRVEQESSEYTPPASLYRSNWLVRGDHVNHDVVSDNVLVRFTGLQAWTDFSGITTTHSQALSDATTEGAISFKEMDPVSFVVNDAQLSIEHSLTITQTSQNAKVESDSSLKIQSTTPMSPDRWMEDWVVPFVRFVQFCVGHGGEIELLSFKSIQPEQNDHQLQGPVFTPSPSRRLPTPGTALQDLVQRKLVSMNSLNSVDQLSKWYELYRKGSIRPALEAFIDVRIGARNFTNAERAFIFVRCLEQLYSVESGNERFSASAYKEIKDSARDILTRDGLLDKDISNVILGIKHLREDSLKEKIWKSLVQASHILPFDDELKEAITRLALKVRNDFAHTGIVTVPLVLAAVTTVLECLVISTILAKIEADSTTMAKRLSETVAFRNAWLLAGVLYRREITEIS